MHSSFERAKRLSRMMQHALVAIGVGTSGIALWLAVKAFSDPVWVSLVFKEKFRDLGAEVFSTGQVFGFVLLFFTQIALLLMAFRALWQAFGSIVQSEGITLGTAQWIRSAGFWFGVTTLMMILSVPLNSLIGSVGAEVGQRFLSIGFESQHMLAFLLSAVLLILGHVLALAAEIADDNRQIV
ncbi:MAG: hypothetical protein ACRCU5_07385 [Rhizobiaceae bacterium]